MDENSQQIMQQLIEEMRALNESVSTNTQIRRASLTEEERERIKNAGTIADNTEAVAGNSAAVDRSSRAYKAHVSAAEDYNKALQGYAEALKTGTEGIKTLFKNLTSQDPGRTMAKYSSGLEQLGSAVGKVTETMGPYGKAFSIFTQGLTKVIGLQAEQADALLKANDKIAQFGTAGTFTTKELQDMANKAGVTSKNMDVLVKPIQSLGPALINLGGTTGQGVKAFADLAKITNAQREQYQRMGISQEQLMQNQADYIQLQRTSGRVISMEAKDRDALRKASLEYTDNLLQLSAISGQDVETLKKKQQAAASEAELQIKNMMLSDKAAKLRAAGDEEGAKKIEKELQMREKLLAAAVSTGDEQTKQAVVARLATGTWTEQSKQLAIMGVNMEKFEKRMREGEDVSGDFLNSLSDAGKKAVSTFGPSAVFSEEVRKTTGLNKDFMTFLNRGVKDYNKTLDETKKAQKEAGQPGKDPAQDARATLTTLEIEAGKALDKLVGSTNILTGGFTLQTVALTAFGAALVGATGFLSAMAGKTMLQSGADALKAARGGLGSAIPGLGGFAAGGGGGPIGGAASAAGRVAGAAGAAQSAAGTATAAAPAVAKTVGGGADMAKTLSSAGKGLGDLGVGAGKFVAGVGQGGGKAISAIFKGVAAGLQAFANPKVTLGAVGFGAAITAIGAGIAGATWIMGKALPTFAEGLEPITKIDGEKLIKTGKGIAAVGGGLAVFGATGAAAGIGNILGSLVDGFGKLFGVKSPFQKLEEFSKLDIDADKVIKNAEALTAFNKAIGSMTPIPQDVIGSLLSLAGLKPFTKLEEFSKLDMDPDKVKKNSEALLAFNQATSEMKSVPQDITGALASLVGLDPFKKLQEFGKLDMDADKVKKNSDALLAFNKATAEMKPVPTDISGTLTSLIGFKPFTKLEEFSKLDIDTDKTTKNAEALVSFNKAIASMVPIPTDIVGGLASLVGMKPFASFEEFSKLAVDPDAVKKKAEAFEIYNNTIAKAKPAPAATFKTMAAGVGGAVAGMAGALGGAATGAISMLSKPLQGMFSGPKKEQKEAPQPEVQLTPAPASARKITKEDSDSYEKEQLQKIRELEGTRKRMVEKGPATDSLQSKKAHEQVLATLEKAADAERQKLEEYRLKQKTAPKAAVGGIFEGPKSGYPVELHGKEMVTPLGSGAKVGNLEDEEGPISRFDIEDQNEDLDTFGQTLKDSDAILKKFTTTLTKLNEFEQDLLEEKEADADALDDVQDKLKSVFSGAVVDLSNFSKRLKVSTDTKGSPAAGELSGATGGTPLLSGSGAPVLSGSGTPVMTGGVPEAKPPKIEPSLPPPPKPTGAVSAPTEKQDIKQNLSEVKAALMKRGMTDEKYLNAVLGNVMKESGGKVVSENLNYKKTSNQRIRAIFGSRAAGKTDEELNAIKSSPESMGEFMYGKDTKIGRRMGNTEPGDGWKYRGRGYVQLTGKSNYAAASKAIFGDDSLVENPDLVNDPKIAAEVAAWYMQKGKSSMARKMGIDESNMSQEQANLLATSQIAGTDVRKAGGYLGGEVMQKVASYAGSKEIQGIQPAPGEDTGTRVASVKKDEIPKAERGGVFDGPDSGYLVELHGNETVIPNEKIASIAQKKSIKLFSEEMGPTMGGVNEYTGYNAGPMTTDLTAIQKMASKVGAYDDKTQTITDTEVWKKLLHSGMATNYDVGPTTVGTQSLGPDAGDILGDRLKELMEGNNTNISDAIQKLSAEFKEAMTLMSQDMARKASEGTVASVEPGDNSMSEMVNILSSIADKLGEGNDIQGKILQYSKV